MDGKECVGRCRLLLDSIRGIDGNFEDEIITGLSKYPLITVSGGVCSGKTTITENISEIYGFERYAVGMEFRRLAEKAGLTTEEFIAEVCKDQEKVLHHDTLISMGAIKSMASGNGNGYNGMVADGALSGWYGILLDGIGKDNTRIYLDCDPETQFERARTREGCEKKAEQVLEREAMDHERWKRSFDLDPKDTSAYHAVFDTGNLGVNQIVEGIGEIMYGSKNIDRD